MLVKLCGWVRAFTSWILALAVGNNDRPNHSARLRLEALEDRRVLSALANPLLEPATSSWDRIPILSTAATGLESCPTKKQGEEPQKPASGFNSLPESIDSKPIAEPSHSPASVDFNLGRQPAGSTKSVSAQPSALPVVSHKTDKEPEIVPSKPIPEPARTGLPNKLHTPHKHHRVAPLPANLKHKPIQQLIPPPAKPLAEGNPAVHIANESEPPVRVGLPSPPLKSGLLAPPARVGLSAKGAEVAPVLGKPIEIDNGRQSLKAIQPSDTDSDSGDEAAPIAPKLTDSKMGDKGSEQFIGEKATEASENSAENRPEKSAAKERSESVISLDPQSILAAQSRPETRPNEVAQSSPMETRVDLSKETASGNRKDFHKNSIGDDEPVFSKTRSGPESALPNDELAHAQGNAAPIPIWNVDHSRDWIPQAQLPGNPTPKLEGMLGQTLLKGGEGTGFRESVAATAPLWGALFFQALGKIRPRTHQPTIMVVEGDEATRDKYVMSFTDQGYLVLSAPSTHDAMGLLRAPLAPIDLVVVNLNLPDLSGVHLCTYLRKSNPGVPLIVYSDEAEPSELSQLRKLGVNYFLRNPFSVEELVADVNALLH